LRGLERTKTAYGQKRKTYLHAKVRKPKIRPGTAAVGRIRTDLRLTSPQGT